MASCTYNKNDRGGCEPGELDLFRYGMVNYMMTYGNLLDFLEDAKRFRSLCFSKEATTRQDPNYWKNNLVHEYLRRLDHDDQDIWVNLQYVGKNQRAILRRSLRKFKPITLRVDDSTTWTDDLALQVLEEEIADNCRHSVAKDHRDHGQD